MTPTLRRMPGVFALLTVSIAVAPCLLEAQSVQALPIDSLRPVPTAPMLTPSTPVTNTAPTATPTATTTGPQAVPVALTAYTRADVPTSTPQPDDNASLGPNLALMGAGAAGVVVGLLIGGDGGTAIALGGGVVGLIGLYRYLR